MKNLLKKFVLIFIIIGSQQIITQLQDGIWGANCNSESTIKRNNLNEPQSGKQKRIILFGTMNNTLIKKNAIALASECHYYIDKFNNKLNQGWSSLQGKIDETYSLLFWKQK